MGWDTHKRYNEYYNKPIKKRPPTESARAALSGEKLRANLRASAEELRAELRLDPDCDLEKWKANDWLGNCSDAVNKDFRENMPQNPTPQDFRGWGEAMHNCHKKHKAGRCGTCSWEIQDVDRFACERPAKLSVLPTESLALSGEELRAKLRASGEELRAELRASGEELMLR